MMGGFFDRFHAQWDEEQIAWFEALLEEDDPPILDWALGREPPPERFAGPMMAALQKLDYVEIPR